MPNQFNAEVYSPILIPYSLASCYRKSGRTTKVIPGSSYPRLYSIEIQS